MMLSCNHRRSDRLIEDDPFSSVGDAGTGAQVAARDDDLNSSIMSSIAAGAGGGSGGGGGRFSEERVAQFHEFAAHRDVYARLVASFAPSIWELDDAKKGLLCQLFGGTSAVTKVFDYLITLMLLSITIIVKISVIIIIVIIVMWSIVTSS